MSSSIELDVRRGEGLSFAIDRALDEHFKNDTDDVKLNASQWQSVFDIITSNEQAEQTQKNQKQFDKNKDNDVNDSSQYQVNKGKYYLTTDTWNNIVNFVKTNVIKQKQNEEQNQITTDQAAVTQGETPLSVEQKILQILSDANIKTDNLNMDAINAKYEELISQTPALDENIVAQRIKNYAIMQSYDSAEKNFGIQYANSETIDSDIEQLRDDSNKFENPDITEAIQNHDSAKSREALRSWSNEYIAKYDTITKDGKIDFEEFKAVEKGIGDSEIDEETLMKKFKYLSNGDEYIDEKEMSSYYYAMARYADGDENTLNDVTYKEWMAAQKALELVGEENLTDNQKKILNHFTTLKNLAYENL